MQHLFDLVGVAAWNLSASLSAGPSAPNDETYARSLHKLTSSIIYLNFYIKSYSLFFHACVQDEYLVNPLDKYVIKVKGLR